ncbi:hypothetical protein CRUP_009931 [Coryphaenoides rupestris]|nr:hypothetical protein CRUP_009931 [Coryphaenoides rupestris]
MKPARSKGHAFQCQVCGYKGPSKRLVTKHMNTVHVGETDNQKWTKALQSVLSNFPQDINVHPKLENTMMSNSSKDLTVLMPESAEGGPIQENRENEELQLHQNVEEHGKYSKELKCDNSCEDGLCATKELKMAKKRDSRMPRHKYRSRRGRRKAKTRPKALEKGPQGLGLKLVLKKDPVKNKQWMSQSPLLPPDGCSVGGHHGSPFCLPAMEKQGQTLVNGPLAENSKGNKDPKSLSTSTTGGAENPQISMAPCGVPEKNNGGVDRSTPGRKESTTPNEDVNPPRNNGAISSHAAKPLIPPPGAGFLVHSFQPASSHPSGLEDHGSPPGQTTSKGPSSSSTTSSEGLWRVAPRAVVRTLKLTPLSLGQAVKRPRGEQPVVVLNHPDADAPEVARLMEAVQKHRGNVQRVVLSHRTLEAITAWDVSPVQGGSGPSGPSPPPPPSSSSSSSACRSSSVRERFLLKLRLRRTSRRKYRVIRAGADRTDPLVIFRCWFCGRVFVSQDLWIAHRQRHLLEWKRPNCENPELSPTLEK